MRIIRSGLALVHREDAACGVGVEEVDAGHEDEDEVQPDDEAVEGTVHFA